MTGLKLTSRAEAERRISESQNRGEEGAEREKKKKKKRVMRPTLFLKRIRA